MRDGASVAGQPLLPRPGRRRGAPGVVHGGDHPAALGVHDEGEVVGLRRDVGERDPLARVRGHQDAAAADGVAPRRPGPSTRRSTTAGPGSRFASSSVERWSSPAPAPVNHHSARGAGQPVTPRARRGRRRCGSREQPWRRPDPGPRAPVPRRRSAGGTVTGHPARGLRAGGAVGGPARPCRRAGRLRWREPDPHAARAAAPARGRGRPGRCGPPGRRSRRSPAPGPGRGRRGQHDSGRGQQHQQQRDQQAAVGRDGSRRAHRRSLRLGTARTTTTRTARPCTSSSQGRRGHRAGGARTGRGSPPAARPGSPRRSALPRLRPLTLSRLPTSDGSAGAGA